MSFSVKPIGVVHSCYKDKFGVPRQPGLVNQVVGRLELFPPYNRREAFAGLEGFSHLWLLFVFHHCLEQHPRLTVRPPRLGGNRRIGVFASRATHRPNSLGLSVVELSGIDSGDQGVSLTVKGHDLVDGTPILDIKPYVPYADAVPHARGAYAQAAPAPDRKVIFSARAEAQSAHFAATYPGLKELIIDLLALDPRPAYRSAAVNDQEFAIRLHDLDIRWHVQGERFEVVGITPHTKG